MMNLRNMMNFRKLRKNAKAISPIISVLLMIAVAVVAALVVYAWVMGYIGFQTGNAGKEVVVQSMTIPTTATTPTTRGQITVYVQNIGSSPVNVIQTQCLYINGTLDTNAKITNPTVGTNGVAALTGSQTATIVSQNAAGFIACSGDTVTVKVVSSDGTWNQITQTFP